MDSHHRFRLGALCLGAIALVMFCYLPNLYQPFFLIDDLDLVEIPQLFLPFQQFIRVTFFSWGNHVDFYPFRDLSYWLDIHFVGNQKYLDPVVFRQTNLLLFFLAGLGLYQGMRRLKIRAYIAGPMAVLWLLNPFHYEMVWWVSARKDILALCLFIWSAYCWLRFEENQGWLDGILALILFVGSLLSKATFNLVTPILLVSVLKSPKKSARTLFVTVVLNILTVGWTLITCLHYETINDMRFLMPWSYRVPAALVGLGKEVVGTLFWGVNSIDLINWGDWVQMNFPFAVVGLFVVGAWICCLYLLRRAYRGVSFLFLALVTYLPSSGLLFPHRYFYSTRYFEATFLVLWVGLAYFLNKFTALPTKKLAAFLFGALLILFSIGLKVESTHWDSNWSITHKALKLSPKNISLKTLHWLSLKEKKNTSDWTTTDNQVLEELQSELPSQCIPLLEEAPPQHGTLCYLYLKYLADLEVVGNSQVGTKKWNAINAWLMKFTALRTRQSLKEIEKRSWARRVLFGGLREPPPVPNLSFFPKERDRILWLRALELVGTPDFTIEKLKKGWLDRGLLKNNRWKKK